MNNFTYYKDHDFTGGRKYIGSSDIPTLALMNLKYDQTPLMLYEQIKGIREPFRGNERTRAGKELEPIVLKWGLEKIKTGYQSKELLNAFLITRYKNIPDCSGLFSFTEAIHPDREYKVSHADLIVDTADNFIMEAKTTGFFGGTRKDDINFGYDKDDMSANGIPSSVYLQIQDQMLVYDIPIAYVSVMIDTGMHRLYGPIPAHKKTQEKILALCERFWWHVENNKPPKPETWSDIISRNPILDKESKIVIAGEDEEKVIEMKEQAAAIRKKQKKLNEEMDDIKNAIGLLIGENAYLESATGDSLAKAFEVARETVKLKDLKESHPRKYKTLKKDGFISESKSRQVRF